MEGCCDTTTFGQPDMHRLGDFHFFKAAKAKAMLLQTPLSVWVMPLIATLIPILEPRSHLAERGGRLVVSQGSQQIPYRTVELGL